MIGISEILVIVGFAGFAIGPRGMPKMAREAGKAIGTAVRFLKYGRSALTSFAKENEVEQLHTELKQGLDEVNQIRSEWQRLSNPGSFSNLLMDATDMTLTRGRDTPTPTQSGAQQVPTAHELPGGGQAAQPPAQAQAQVQTAQAAAQQQQQQQARPPTPAATATATATATAGQSQYGAGAQFLSGSLASRYAARFAKRK